MTSQSSPDTNRELTEPVTITGEPDLESTVSAHDVVLVDFYADWCGPCRMMEPDLEAIAEETDVVVAKVDVDANQGLATQFGVRGVPTLVLYVDGEQVHREVGMVPGDELRSLIEEYR